MRIMLLLASTAMLAASGAYAQDAGAVLAANRAASGGDALAGKGVVEVKGAYSGQGLTGAVATVFDVKSGDFVDSFAIGPTKGANGFDGRQAWMQDMSGAVTPQAGGDTHQLAVNEAYRDANAWWLADRGGATVTSL
jgi:hypothetical protein